MIPDYYNILGIQPEANESEIRQAYKVSRASLVHDAKPLLCSTILSRIAIHPETKPAHAP